MQRQINEITYSFLSNVHEFILSGCSNKALLNFGNLNSPSFSFVTKITASFSQLILYHGYYIFPYGYLECKRQRQTLKGNS